MTKEVVKSNDENNQMTNHEDIIDGIQSTSMKTAQWITVRLSMEIVLEKAEKQLSQIFVKIIMFESKR